MYANDLVLRSDSNGNLRVITGYFVEVCISVGLKINGDKIKVILAGREGRIFG